MSNEKTPAARTKLDSRRVIDLLLNNALIIIMLVVAKMFLNKFKHSMIVKNSKTELAKKEAVHSGTDS